MIDVLFVDDELDFAVAWSERIVGTMQVNVLATSDPAEALAVARSPGVKLAVIDAVLAGTATDGVALGVAIQQIDPRTRWILLSGEATAAQITAAYDSGVQRHIHKNDAIGQLPTAIRQYLVRYGVTLATSIVPGSRPVFVKKTSIARRQEVKYYLISIDSIDRDYVSEDEWVSITQLNSGERREETLEVGWTRTDSMEYTVESTMGTSTQLALTHAAKLSSELRSEITRREHLESIVSASRSYKVVRQLSLPNEPADPTALYVRSRLFQVAPVYVKVDVTMVSRCSCCSHDEPWKWSIFYPRSRLATRQRDFLSNGTNSTTDTGIADISQGTAQLAAP